MAKQFLLPEEWRDATGLSQDAVARLLGVRGKNPAGTYRRWAIGACRPPLEVVEQVRLLSKGKVTAASWITVRNQFVADNGGQQAA